MSVLKAAIDKYSKAMSTQENMNHMHKLLIIVLNSKNYL
jgi:hypothetical protein